MMCRTGLWLMLGVAAASASAEAEAPRNVILMIGDGMGFGQVAAGGLYANGEAGSLVMESMERVGKMTTCSASSAITDSAASSTAMATGVKVRTSVLSVAVPGDGEELYTVLEWARDRGRSTGLVTTVEMVDATPAAFGAHERNRYGYEAVAGDYLTQTRPNVLFGGGSPYLASAADAGYEVVSDAASLATLDTESAGYVCGLFGDGDMPYEIDGMGELPDLATMTRAALAILDNNPEGFFLMVEGGLIDDSCHFHRIDRAVTEVAGFDRAVGEVLAWADGRADTLVIVTADHETGGLEVVAGNGPGQPPEVTWTSTYHTAADVPIYSQGVNARYLTGTVDNADLFGLMTGVVPTPGDASLDGVVGVADLVALAEHYGLSEGVGWKQGDFTDDGEVGIADLSVLADFYGSARGSVVPEPTAAVVLAGGGVVLLLGAKRRRRFRK